MDFLRKLEESLQEVARQHELALQKDRSPEPRTPAAEASPPPKRRRGVLREPPSLGPTAQERTPLKKTAKPETSESARSRPTDVKPEPPPPTATLPAVTGLDRLGEAVLWSEILGPPRALKGWEDS